MNCKRKEVIKSIEEVELSLKKQRLKLTINEFLKYITKQKEKYVNANI
jgi:hypothetical protein